MDAMTHVDLGALPKTDEYPGTPVFGAVRFQTPWRELAAAELPAGGRFAPPSGTPSEQGYLVLEGIVDCVCGNRRERLPGPGALLLGVGETHSVSNPGPLPARLLYANVETDGPAADERSLLTAAVDPEELTWRDAIHGGCGRIATRHIWGPDDFRSTWTFLDHAVLAADSSVGHHYHDALEECFLIRRGRGYMTISDRTFEVGPGSATWQGIGHGHGIYNPGPEELDFLRVAVAQRDEPFTTVDLHDDLSARRP